MNNNLFSTALDKSVPQAKSQTRQPSLSKAEQAQRLTEIGEKLRQTREQQALSIHMVAAYTMIRVSLLHALEQGQLQHLPEPVYTQGLIKRYGEALGLNGSELAQFFLPEPVEPLIQSPLKLLSFPQLRPTHLYLTYILLVICAVNGLSYLIKPNTQADPSNQPVIADVTPVQSSGNQTASSNATPLQGQLVAQSEEVVPTGSVSSMIKPKPDAVEIGLTIKDESWILIEVDGQPEFEGILAGGTKQTWKATKELVVVAGNAGGVLITVNNGEAKRLGEPGMVEEVTFTSDTLQSHRQNPKL